MTGSSPHAGRRLARARTARAWTGLIPARGETTPPGGRPHRGGRLIPARGETTVTRRSSAGRSGAHPRTRGDDCDPGSPRRGRGGSSPHAGRRQVTKGGGEHGPGLIPARGETTHAGADRSAVCQAHPRTRGDDDTWDWTVIAATGSSPHAGRRRVAEHGEVLAAGLIPARGETTPARRCPCRRWPAHPRTRGDDVGQVLVWWTSTGSSPHAGRRRAGAVRRAVGGGLIPARGETTNPSHATSTASTAHPRTRGDDRREGTYKVTVPGSSPHAGRRRPPAQHEQGGLGLIPARGETTTGGGVSGSRRRAHPRTRGDDITPTTPSTTPLGSSPHAGRRRASTRLRASGSRLIPARGETTGSSPARTSATPAHPRTRGDDWRAAWRASSTAGSSPHAGRRLPAAAAVYRGQGLIPARGETTVLPQGSRADQEAHPRTRGDDAGLNAEDMAARGSSPHAGRRPHGRHRRPRVERLIPARGETTAPSDRHATATRAHPRTRGDDGDSTGDSDTEWGSSPHAGRRRTSPAKFTRARRLIPARGETTTRSTPRVSRPRAHPRTRGDDEYTLTLPVTTAGSSPHAGRRHCARPGGREPRRLIPARGETTGAQ
ncbi:Domain of uncharacterised function (DUF2825) [Cellulomonas fimi]|nr:Domain of uncharacterised function (DUF2825) [Cellulomonas fimi]